VSITSLHAIAAAESEVSSASLEPWGQRPGATGEAATSGWKLLDQDGRIQLANRAFVELFGVSSDVRGKTVLEVVRQHELDKLIEAVVA